MTKKCNRLSALLIIALLWQPLCLAAEISQTPRSSEVPNSAPPRGAIVLFNGRNLDAWLSQKERRWEDSNGPADWKILKDRSLEVVPGAGSLITKQKFADIKLHFEYRL